MSRNITANHIPFSKEALQEQTSEEGKMIFTRYKGQNCSILLKGSRILSMQALTGKPNRIGAVYIGRVSKVEESMQAYFVEIAGGEICFLPLKNAKDPFLCKKSAAKAPGLHQGDELLVQIEREAHKTKPASVTAHISLSNQTAAIHLGNSGVGFSAKLSPEKKKQLGALLEESCFFADRELPVGLVFRTQAQNSNKETILKELSELKEQLSEILQKALHRTCFSCIREAVPDFIAVLDQLVYSYEYSEILTDDKTYYEDLKVYCEKNLPDKQVRLYQDPLFSLSKLYGLEAKAEMAFNARIWLKSGAYLVIEPTEALTVIDVNSGKYTAKRAEDKEAFICAVNTEAAKEVALQLRLRNLSGTIIVDFINMKQKADQENLLAYLSEQVRQDKQSVKVVDITPLGLVEIVRKRDTPSLKEQFLQQT